MPRQSGTQEKRSITDHPAVQVRERALTVNAPAVKDNTATILLADSPRENLAALKVLLRLGPCVCHWPGSACCSARDIAVLAIVAAAMRGVLDMSFRGFS
jgi:hypothetical protein